MAAKIHTHRAVAKLSYTRGYSHCVGGHRNEAYDHAAHGGVVVHDTCRCGATRASEHNGRHHHYGPWIDSRD